MDKFNDIWKDRFNQGDIAEADWNTPDTEVWAAIQPHVPRRDRKPFILLIILGLFLLGSGALCYTSLSKNTISQDLSPIVDQSVLAFGETNVDASVALEKDLLQNTQYSKLRSATAAAQRFNQRTQEPQRVKNTSKGAPARLHAMLDKQVVEIENVTDPNFKIIYTGGVDDNSKLNANTDPIADEVIRNNTAVSMLQTPIAALEKDILPSRLQMKAVLDIPATRSWSIAVVTGASRWQHRISDSYTDDLAPFEFNYADGWGWSTAATLTYYLGDKLAINAGIGYEQVETRSGHNSNLTYDQNLEQGDNSNDYQANLATPYGLSGASFRFAREENLNSESVDLLVDFHSSHTIQNFSVPVSATYFPIGQKQRWVPSVSLGAGANYLHKVMNELEEVDTNHSAIKYVKQDAAEFADPALNQFHFDVRAGLGVNYRINSAIDIGVQGTYIRGLNPIFEQENYATSIDRFLMQAQIVKRF